MTTCLPGNLAVLPLELVWETLDQLCTPTETPTQGKELDHDCICSLGKLLHTHKNVAIHIHEYLARTSRGQTIRQTIREAIQSDLCFKDKSALEAAVCDEDDCPSCFMLFQKLTPELEHPVDGTWVNKNGWTLFSIAACFGSLEMIKYFCSIESPNGSCIPLLARSANIVNCGPSTLNILCQNPNRAQLINLFTLLVPRLHELNVPGGNGTEGGLSPYQRFLLCQFLSVGHALDFERCGMPLFKASGDLLGKGNVYHAAVINGPEFLEYIHQNTPLSISMHNVVEKYDLWNSPLYKAVNARRLDSVIWLQAHGARDIYDTDEANLTESWKQSAAHLAVGRVCEQSVTILEELLRPLDPTRFPLIFCPLMLQTLVRSLVGFRKVWANGIQPYKVDGIYEERAIEKCKLIKSKFFAGHFRVSVKVRKLMMKVAFSAKRDGLDDLAACIQGIQKPHGDGTTA